MGRWTHLDSESNPAGLSILRFRPGLLQRQTSLGRVFMTFAQAALVVNILNTMPRDALQGPRVSHVLLLKWWKKGGESIESGGK